jgi:multidrug resistance efflux pump
MIIFKRLLKYTLIIMFCLSLGLYRILVHYKTEAFYEFDGNLYFQTVQVGAFSGGEVSIVHVNKGDFVEEGDLLVSLSNPVLMSRLEGIEEVDSRSSVYADYLELQQRAESLEVTAPTNGYVLDVLRQEGSFVRDSDFLITIIPKDSFRYSTILGQNDINYIPDELRNQLKSGNTTTIEFNRDFTVSGQVESFLPLFKSEDYVSDQYRLLVLPDEEFDHLSNLNLKVRLLFPKSNFSANVINGLFKYFPFARHLL